MQKVHKKKDMRKIRIYLAIRVTDGKAVTSQISEKYFNNAEWRRKMVENARKGNEDIYFTETDVYFTLEETQP